MKHALSDREYYSKVYGGWLGKNIGGTLGGPLEGRMELLDLTYYPVTPDGPLANDDLDLQLVWLHALEQYGARLTARELGQEWLEHIFFPYDEYGYALANLRRGLVPPVSGSFNNPFRHCMGSPIRSEIWAMIAPGMPHVAAYYAYQDAVVDHAGGEGVYGEMFFAAIESAAFVESDRDRLIATGLRYIPATCRTAQAIHDLLECHKRGKTWTEAREWIIRRHGHPNFTDAPQNIAFTLLGWLYGEDFGDALLKAVNCGYDTDCTGATLGAILGIIAGKDGLPERWVAPVGDRVVVSPPIKGFPAPQSLDELTQRTMRIGREIAAFWNDAAPGEEEKLLGVRDASPEVNVFPFPRGAAADSGLTLAVDYGPDGPAIGLGQTKRLHLTLHNRSLETWEGWLELAVPSDWREVPKRPFRLEAGCSLEWNVELKAGAVPRVSHELAVMVCRTHDDAPWHTEKVPFVLIGAAHWLLFAPDNDRGVPAAAAGNRVPFAEVLHTDKPGVYKAATRLFIPGDRELRLVIATSSPVKAALNGRTIVADDKEAAFMPAFHRAPASRCVTLPIAAGEHRLELEVVKKDRPLEVYVLPVSSKSKKQPGSYYYLTDVLFLPVNDADASAETDGVTAGESAGATDNESAGETVSVSASKSAGKTIVVSDGE